MPNPFDKVKGWLDWLQHGYLIAQLLLALASGKTVKALLATYTNLSSMWITPLWLGVSAAVLALIVFVSNRLRSSGGEETKRLVIHFAVYGTGPQDDVVITDKLNAAP